MSTNGHIHIVREGHYLIEVSIVSPGSVLLYKNEQKADVTNKFIVFSENKILDVLD
jgi:hypothetical protein